MDHTDPTADPTAASPRHPSRRQVLAAAPAAALAATAVAATVGTTRAGAQTGPQGGSLGEVVSSAVTNSLVVVFLRGGADGLSLVAPVADPVLATARPTIGVTAATGRPLAGPAPDTRFAFHPALERVASMYAAGRANVALACGLPLGTRSHFEDQASLELAGNQLTGWAGRLLAATSTATDDTLRAVGIGSGLPAALRGYPAIATPSLAQLSLATSGPRIDQVRRALATYDRPGAHPVLTAWDGPARATLARTAQLGDTARPASWPNSPAADALWPVARLLQAGIPTQLACVDIGDWDTHENMGSPGVATTYGMHLRLARLDAALGAFFDTLGPVAERTTVVIVTEFGRRLTQNGSGGVDHGRSFPIITLGAGVRPGTCGTWPGLVDLDAGDVRVTTDYRHVLAELAARRLGATGAQLAAAFPNFTTGAGRWLNVAA